MVTSHGTDWPLWLFWAGFALAIVSFALYARRAAGTALELTLDRGRRSGGAGNPVAGFSS